LSSDIVSIKGTKNGLLIILDPNHDYEDIKKTLLRKMESARGFFKGAKFTLTQGQQEIPANQKYELESICQQYGLIPNTGKAASIKTNNITEIDTGVTKPRRKITSVSAQSDIGEAALLVRRSLRSGQRITHESHIIVLGDIHPGAEVISGGNVLVIGSCRGMVHAGAGGNASAKVIARRLEPTSLTIAEKRLSQELSKTVPKECLVVRLSGPNFVFEKFQAGR
jgi:septum site-determining protein MinC